MGGRASFREHLALLEERGLLTRIRQPVDKNTELMPLVRWQFRGLPEAQRKAFVFENVTDGNGRSYDVAGVVVGALAASRVIYALGFGCEPDEVAERWARAQRRPVEPVLVRDGPCQEVVIEGEALRAEGLDRLPVPIATPGFDNAPYISAGHWVTKDPATGIRNVGNYRGQLKATNRLGINFSPTQHIGRHWQACIDRGIPLEVAISIGVTPHLSFAAVTKVPFGVDEYAVAGGISGEPLELVKARTVDLEVPADAEIVIEGRLGTEYREPEGPHGEFTGYIGPRRFLPFMDVSCITHRRNPYLVNIISQFPPSESSKIRQIGTEGAFYKFLRYDCNIPAVRAVAFPESGGAAQMCVIQIHKTRPSESWQALYGACAFAPTQPNYVVVVDDDIDPWDADSVNWALCFRTQPWRDLRVLPGKAGGISPATAEPGFSREQADFPPPYGATVCAIDATRKWGYTPVSLPAREYMEHARGLWERLGLPALEPRSPWHGYELGDWSDRDRMEAARAAGGDYFETGETIIEERRPIPRPQEE
jgi:UbiD family decarboxylase